MHNKNSNKIINKIIICGFGSIGKQYLKTIKKYWPKIEISLLRSSSNKKEINKDVKKTFYKIEEALAWDPDAAIISSPAIYHVEQALSFTKSRIPVLVEKPIGSLNNKSDELELLRERSKNSLVLVGYLLRHEPCLKVLYGMMKENRIGKILEADFYCGSWLPKWREGKEYSQTVSANSELGGGVLLELSHEIDLAHFLFDDLTILGANLCKSNILKTDVEEQAYILAKSKNVQISIRLNFCTRPEKRFINLRGEKGEISWDIINNQLKLIDEFSKFNIINFENNSKGRLGREIEHFFSCIKGDVNPICTTEDGIRVLDTIKTVKLLSEKKI